ncbi:MAG: hypothetical protein VXW65_13160 [Pseudomonadota bacterium]|nr:hypothetical protein [Pseudomonadota bacterium]
MNAIPYTRPPISFSRRTIDLFGLGLSLLGALIILGSNIIGLMFILAGLLLQRWFVRELHLAMSMTLDLRERLVLAGIILAFVPLLSPKGFITHSLYLGLDLIGQHAQKIVVILG